MNVLLVYPKSPRTFWSFAYAVGFLGKRAAQPPLGLITVAAMLPRYWKRRLIDTNVDKLFDDDIRWADYVFLGGMDLHRKSFEQIALRCRSLGVKVVGGGPFCSLHYLSIDCVDHFVLNEAECTLPDFIRDVEHGNPQPVYISTSPAKRFPDLNETPIPQWDLLNLSAYASMGIQFSRGCPFDCEFCSITPLFGRKPRCKGSAQFINEIDALHECGWRGSVFVVDDNFIGNKKFLKEELLPALSRWSDNHGVPFSFTTEVSINLADDELLIDGMVDAGFRMVFIGIETPEESNLRDCGKIQNIGRNLLGDVKHLQHKGLEVSAGFIVGFDNDTPDIFDRQIQFIQESGIVIAMVGLLTALAGTKLFSRLDKEHRIRHASSGDNTDGELNFVPRMASDVIQKGYRRVVNTIYSPKSLCKRIRVFLSESRVPETRPKDPDRRNISAVLRILWRIGILGRGRGHFWKLMIYVLKRYPKRIAEVLRLSVYGFHLRKVAEKLRGITDFQASPIDIHPAEKTIAGMSNGP